MKATIFLIIGISINLSSGGKSKELRKNIFDCNLGKIHEVGELKDLYHKREVVTENGTKYVYIGPVNYTIEETEVFNQFPTQMTGIIQTLIAEDLFYMQALEGERGLGKILIRNEEKLYLIRCKEVTAKKMPQIEECYVDETVWYKEGLYFVNAATRILQKNSEKIQCGSKVSLFYQLMEAVNDQKLIKLNNKAITFSLWKGKTFTKDIAKLLNKESTKHLMESEEGVAYGDLSGRKIMAQVQLFLRLHTAKIAITWGVLQVIGILAVVAIGRWHKVKWWKIITILSSIAKVVKETKESIIQAKLDRKMEKLKIVQRSRENLVDESEEETTKMEPHIRVRPTNETHKEFVHRHLENVYICIWNMEERMEEAERKNREEKARNSEKWKAITGKGEDGETEWSEMEVIPYDQGRRRISRQKKWKRMDRMDRTRRRPLEIEGPDEYDEERRKTIQGITTTQETTERTEEGHENKAEDRRASMGASIKWTKGTDNEREEEVTIQGTTSNGEALCEHLNQVKKEERRWRRSQKGTSNDDDRMEGTEGETNIKKTDMEKQEEGDE